jgi:hypothetical protein
VQAVDSWQAIIPETVHGGGAYAVDIALAITAAQPALTGAAIADMSIESRLADGSFVIRGTRTRLNVSRREDNFKLHYRSSLTGIQSPVDYFGNLLYVDYNSDPQTATVDVDVPLFEVTATGIRDITPVGTVAAIQTAWTGAVNSDEFNANQGAAIGAYSLRCEGVTAEPLYYNEATEQDVYRISFVFLGRNGGWRDTIYWKDPTTGLPPYDTDVTAWSKEIVKYKEMNYDQTWPFGTGA